VATPIAISLRAKLLLVFALSGMSQIHFNLFQEFFLGDSSFGATKNFHVLDIQHEISVISRKF
jgi:hypothetical protein